MRSRDAERARRLDVGRLADHEHRAAHHARHARRVHDADGDDHVGDARAERGHERDREDDGRKRHEPVHDAHDRVVEAPEVPGAEPGGHARPTKREQRPPPRRPAARAARRTPRARRRRGPRSSVPNQYMAPGARQPRGHVHAPRIDGDERREQAHDRRDEDEDGADGHDLAPDEHAQQHHRRGLGFARRRRRSRHAGERARHGEARGPRVHWYFTRGSMTRYERSTSRFTSM